MVPDHGHRHNLMMNTSHHRSGARPTAMHALTILQPWASLIVLGLKTFVERYEPPPGRVIGERIVIHAAARYPHRTIRTLLGMSGEKLREVCGPDGDIVAVRAFLEAASARPLQLPLGAGLGTAVVGAPVTTPGPFALWDWPLLAIERWPEPVPARGTRHLWSWQLT